jgi:hypothetical protein
MLRRDFLALVPVALVAQGGNSVKGKLTKDASGNPALRTQDGKVLPLTGDTETTGVLKDERLQEADFEVVGKMNGSTFAIDPIHTAALYVHKGGKRLRVTYWCDVCAIRTYTPGLCWCCREETALDLREPDTVVTK